MQEIILPDNFKPALEWVNNRILQKVSPERKHGLAQGVFWSALNSWARAYGTGTAAVEWRFHVLPPGKIRRPLVPDVAYLSYKRMPLDEQERLGTPSIAPDAVVEILSRGDKPADVEEKIRVYLAAGTQVLFVVDTECKTVAIHDGEGERVVSESAFVEHRSLEGLRFAARDLFESPPDRGGRP